MEVKIGIQHAPRELTVDCQEDQQTVESKVTAALPDGVLSLTDTRGRKIIVPGDRIAYVEIGGGVTGTVGFRS
ncbi:DUF3107 domain-containing protein [Nocardioides bigeumensis]|uniref:DUF3107 domain-containing protein n=1 Tax=Nocardioides bigeumensis TaxID=433657 RepID=A0ABP5K154_9ACTN